MIRSIVYGLKDDLIEIEKQVLQFLHWIFLWYYFIILVDNILGGTCADFPMLCTLDFGTKKNFLRHSFWLEMGVIIIIIRCLHVVCKFKLRQFSKLLLVIWLWRNRKKWSNFLWDYVAFCFIAWFKLKITANLDILID